MRAILCLLLLAPAFAHAATLRRVVTLAGPTVHLSDLFGDAGAQADRVLGPGPTPGGQIVVEAPQLAAIARQFGVAWQPASDADRSVLTWPGKPLPRAAILRALRPALAAAGAAKDADISLADFTPPMIAANAAPGVMAGVMAADANYDAASGHFSATLTFGGTNATQSLRVSGFARETVAVPVLTHRLLPGDIIGPGDLRVAHLPADTLHDAVARAPTQAIGMTVRHFVPEGAPLALADLQRPAVVTKGARVRMMLSAAGLELSAQAVALGAGAVGEQVQVMNPVSHAVLLAEVTGPGAVRVMPGSTPLSPATRSAGNAYAAAYGIRNTP